MGGPEKRVARLRVEAKANESRRADAHPVRRIPAGRVGQEPEPKARALQREAHKEMISNTTEPVHRRPKRPMPMIGPVIIPDRCINRKLHLGQQSA